MNEFCKDVPPAQVSYRRYKPGIAIGSPSAVRTYRYSPDRVAVQIRTGKGYATATLPFDVAQALANAITDAVKGL